MTRYKRKKAVDFFTISLSGFAFGLMIYGYVYDKLSIIKFLIFLFVFTLFYGGLFHEYYSNKPKKKKAKGNFVISSSSLGNLKSTLPPFMDANLGWVDEDTVLISSDKNYFKNSKEVDNITLHNITALERKVKKEAKQ